MTAKVYICVLNYNNPGDTIECLESLSRLSYGNYHVLVIDNASTDDSEEQLRGWLRGADHRFSYLPMKANLGYAGGNNAGLRYAMAQGDMGYAWILNNDTMVEQDALGELVKKMESDERIGICGSKVMYAWDRSRIQCYGGRHNKYLGVSHFITDAAELGRMNLVYGAAVFVRKSFLETVGLMNEAYFLFFEEQDWAVRARGKFRLACAENSVVYHKEGASIGANTANLGQKSRLSDYYMVRNRILFTRTYFPQCLPTVYLGLLATIGKRVWRRQYGRIGMIMRLMLGMKDDALERH